MEITTEDRELEFELTLDASSFGHTDLVHQIALHAAEAALSRLESCDQRVASSRATTAVTAALSALELAGHLVPEGVAVTQRWVVMTHDGIPRTLPLDADDLREFMVEKGLADSDHVDSIRTIVSTVPREATRPQPAPEPALAAEVNF